MNKFSKIFLLAIFSFSTLLTMQDPTNSNTDKKLTYSSNLLKGFCGVSRAASFNSWLVNAINTLYLINQIDYQLNDVKQYIDIIDSTRISQEECFLFGNGCICGKHADLSSLKRIASRDAIIVLHNYLNNLSDALLNKNNLNKYYAQCHSLTSHPDEEVKLLSKYFLNMFIKIIVENKLLKLNEAIQILLKSNGLNGLMDIPQNLTELNLDKANCLPNNFEDFCVLFTLTVSLIVNLHYEDFTSDDIGQIKHFINSMITSYNEFKPQMEALYLALVREFNEINRNAKDVEKTLKLKSLYHIHLGYDNPFLPESLFGEVVIGPLQDNRQLKSGVKQIQLKLPKYDSRLLEVFSGASKRSQDPYHLYSHMADAIILLKGVKTFRPNLTYPGKKDRLLSVLGKIKYANGATECVLFTIALNYQGKCYHRGYKPIPIESIKKLNEKAYANFCDDIDKPFTTIVKYKDLNCELQRSEWHENDLFIEIADENHNMLISLYKHTKLINPKLFEQFVNRVTTTKI